MRIFGIVSGGDSLFISLINSIWLIMATIKRTQNNPLNHGRASCKKTPELPDFRDSRHCPHFANEAPASDVINNQIASWFTCPALPFGRTKAKIAFGLESLPPVGTQPFRPRDPSHDDFEKFLTDRTARCSLWKKKKKTTKNHIPYTKSCQTGPQLVA